MRIALVSDWFHPRRGGLEAQLLGLAKALRDMGHQPHVITSYAGDGMVDGLIVERMPGRCLPNTKVVIPVGQGRRLQNFFRNGGFDVVHINLSSVTPFAFMALRAAKALKLPVLITMHSRSYGGATFLRMMQTAGLCNPAGTRLTVVGSKLLGQLRLVKTTGKTRILPNGVDYAFWSETYPKPTTPATEGLRIVAGMRLEWTKRPGAMPAVLKRVLDAGVPAQLDIAGSGQLAGRLIRIAKRLGVAGHLKLHDWQTPEELRNLYRQADVFLSTSQREAFGIAGLEARLAGLPLVAYSGTGMSDYLEDGRDGILCSSDEKLAAALVLLAKGPTLLHSLSGPRPHLKSYDWPNICAQYLSEYEAVIRDAGNDVSYSLPS